MAIFNEASPPEAIAIKAQSVDEQALNLNATLNKLSTTIAGVWDLESTSNKVPEATWVKHMNPGAESVIEGDDRKLVKPEDFMPGGKYRSIIKLFIKYENLSGEKFAHGTGWLIRPDLLVTAGHNVFSWKSNAGKAREIKAYAGYDGASSIGKSTVEFRKAKRVVTTSQWLSNRGSMAHDFALVQLDEPFTNVTPFQYIETPSKDKTVLGVVGYPADKVMDGERGGKMYELFEKTDYDITEQRDTMLQHFIDSEGGNSGGPVLRGADLVAIATHVYGGEFNTASVLGRYGNPVQDYLAALELPLQTAGKINLVKVNGELISQEDAATGPQAKEIAKLGDNTLVLAQGPADSNGTGANKAEFWLPMGLKEVFDLTSGVEKALGPAFAPFAQIIRSNIVQGIKLSQPESEFDIQNALGRAVLADMTLSAAQVSHAKEEGFFDDVFATVGEVSRFITPKYMLNPVAGLVAQGLAQARPDLFNMAKQESSIDGTAPSANEAAFFETVAKTLASNEAKEEGWLDDVGDFVKGAAGKAADVVTDGAKLVTNTVSDGAKFVGSAVDRAGDEVGKAAKGVAFGVASGVDQVVSAGNTVGDAAKNAANTVVSGVTQVAQTVNNAANTAISSANEALKIASTAAETQLVSVLGPAPKNPEELAKFLSKITGLKTESAMDGKEESLMDILDSQIRKISQAFIYRAVMADMFLTAQMQRPVAELKEEGFFDTLKDIANGPAARLLLPPVLAGALPRVVTLVESVAT